MDFYCDHCGFHTRFGLGMAPDDGQRKCHVCGIGRLRRGVPETGFRVENCMLRPFGPGGPGHQVHEIRKTGGFKELEQLNYFAGVAGQPYVEIIQTETVYLGEFNKYLLPETDQFAWLSPYTGNKHNQRWFTQAALARVAIAQFQDNGGVFPALIEPFVGSGQVFLNSCCWGPAINQGIPLFHTFAGGDLNPYVISTYELLRDEPLEFMQLCQQYAKEWDRDVAKSFELRLKWLASDDKPEPADTWQMAAFSAISYIYVVNRCVRGSKLNLDTKAVQATIDPGLVGDAKALQAIRANEISRLQRAQAMINTLGSATFACQDFEETCNFAQPADIVFMDCPFPKFDRNIPEPGAKNPEAASTAANTYGVGDDGGEFQTRIVDVARELINRGTTVILCNFATPGIIRAYTNLLREASGVPAEFCRFFNFTYCSPATTSEAYLLTILPGRGRRAVRQVPGYMHALWQQVAEGDDNFGEPATQQFFCDCAVEPFQWRAQDWNGIEINIDSLAQGRKRKASEQPDAQASEQPDAQASEQPDAQASEQAAEHAPKLAKKRKVETQASSSATPVAHVPTQTAVVPAGQNAGYIPLEQHYAAEDRFLLEQAGGLLMEEAHDGELSALEEPAAIDYDQAPATPNAMAVTTDTNPGNDDMSVEREQK